MIRRLRVPLFLAAIAGVIYKALPDVRRYLKIRGM